MQESSSERVMRPRVVMLIHNPVFEKQDGRKMNQLLGWNDPDVLAQHYIRDVAEASYGLVQYQVVERHEVDGYPVKQDGFSYTDDSFLRYWRARSGFHQPDGADYLQLLNSVSFLEKVEANQADELWLFGFPYAGYYESAMGGRDAIWCNAPPINRTQFVDRRFVVMGFNYERGVGEMLEDLGHRAESIMEHVFRHAPRPMNLWQQFTLYDKVAPGRSACGNVHFAPNSERDYDWGNRRAIRSTCDDWLQYPDLRGTTRTVTCSEWGNGDMRAHHLWWFRHFPHTRGSTVLGVSNNWWEYIIGLDFT
jgi:hypothetical protein